MQGANSSSNHLTLDRNIEASGQDPPTVHCDNDSNTLPNVCHEQSKLEIESQTTPVGFWDRLTGEGRATVGLTPSIVAIMSYSWLNVLFIFVPIAWLVHPANNIQFSYDVAFALNIIALLPSIKLLHYTGDQLALNCGKTAGDVIMVTVHNFVEAVLAITLLYKCELKLLQSTIAGFVLLRLLLVSGTAFITGGLRRRNQTLHAHQSQLNQTLLMMGTLTLLLPAVFYNALDHDPLIARGGVYVPNTVNEALRDQILEVSRALSPLLLVAYICSCCYVHYPPGDEGLVYAEKDADPIVKPHCTEKPEVNFWTCLVTMLIIGGLMAATAELLVTSIRPMKYKIREEFFGLVLIPVVSYSADALLLSVYFIHSQLRYWFGAPYKPPGSLAETHSIDLSIQFFLFWTPLLVLIGWIVGKPFSLLFDTFEVAVLLAAAFLLNYVTFDSKTNWAEGTMLVTFYFMIAITAWFYPGRRDIRMLLSCDILSNNTMTVIRSA